MQVEIDVANEMAKFRARAPTVVRKPSGAVVPRDMVRPKAEPECIGEKPSPAPQPVADVEPWKVVTRFLSIAIDRPPHKLDRKCYPFALRVLSEPEMASWWNYNPENGFSTNFEKKKIEKIPATVVIRAVSEYYGVELSDIIGVRREQRVVIPRQVCMWILGNSHKRLSWPQIGRQLGGRDHSTCLSGRNRIDRLLASGNFSIPDHLLALIKPVED